MRQAFFIFQQMRWQGFVLAMRHPFWKVSSKSERVRSNTGLIWRKKYPLEKFPSTSAWTRLGGGLLGNTERSHDLSCGMIDKLYSSRHTTEECGFPHTDDRNAITLLSAALSDLVLDFSVVETAIWGMFAGKTLVPSTGSLFVGDV